MSDVGAQPRCVAQKNSTNDIGQRKRWWFATIQFYERIDTFIHGRVGIDC